MQMKGVVSVIFIIFLRSHLGTPLECHTCDFPCIMKSNTTCQAQEVCVTKVGAFAGFPCHKRGCTNSTVCDTETTEVIMGTAITVMNQCCKTNLCNSAVHLEVPTFSILAVCISKLC
ncbi:CD59 glycoprotein-like isoform X1 [Bufo bufo]|uniref:CD59 glycoprotein-like isoform X1 n=1 Tax=Bufo bufo TaxID=8384 RepID=UPI001ABE6715|nr:CD59 glycoprotein-like isoform X1 [Bufo bufo]